MNSDDLEEHKQAYNIGAGVDFLTAEYQYHFAEYQRLEQIGETRVNLFIAIAAAVFGGSSFVIMNPLIDSRNDILNHFLLTYNILFFAFCLAFLFGLITIIRLINRNLDSYKHKRAMGRIRHYFAFKIAPQIRDYLYDEPYDDLPIRQKKLVELVNMGGGGLIETVALINSFLGASIILILLVILGISFSILTFVAVGFGTLFSIWILQFLFVKLRYERSEPNTNQIKFRNLMRK